MSLTDRLAGVLDKRLSRRNFVVRSAFVGSALTVGGAEFVLTPGSAYAQICTCANTECGCGQTCCIGFTEFCCVLDGGYNSCPENTVMGGWWRAEGSEYCDGPRYYMDCNAVCRCDDGCGDGYQFCDTGCDGLTCECADNNCNNFLTGCFQFRYGQCNQDVTCLGRIHCRVVTCVPPWEVDPTCTTANAEDDGTANQNAACLTPGPTYPCDSPNTKCEVVGIASSLDGGGYLIVTSFGGLFAFGDAKKHGTIDAAIVAITASAKGGYYLVAKGGRVWAHGDATYYGEAYTHRPGYPIVGLTCPPLGGGYWQVTSAGQVYSFGSAKYHGKLPQTFETPFVGMASTHTGGGYWLVTAGGRIVPCGDAHNHGDLVDLDQPDVVAIVIGPSGSGYWLACASGAVYSFGSAGFHGDAVDQDLHFPVVAMARTNSGLGYWLVTADGQVLAYGDAKYHGEEM